MDVNIFIYKCVLKNIDLNRIYTYILIESQIKSHDKLVTSNIKNIT